ncbi:9193_t:CDS:2 [Scutellospora calospora]|uniref:9193_t:CDS:1 n=1 Tax=Scutellospora calospora TaxID=85575 RepID=A0ACA9KNB9_9GLOM|nr:9193_t:CDS:2 [Scutellospora calospora]
MKRGLIENENIYHLTMQEAARFKMPSALQQLFATILSGVPIGYLQINAVLLQIKYYLEQHNKSLDIYDLPPLILLDDNHLNKLPRLLLEELSIPNMRVENSPEANNFRNFLLRIRNGTEQTFDNNDIIRIPDHMVIDWDNEDSLQVLIQKIYLFLHNNSSNISYFTDRAILTTKNEYVDYVNNFLNSLTTSDIPPHELRLKVNAPVICLRNIEPINGLCNGTRLLCHAFHPNVIEAEIVTGSH